jgi:pimeloyl-ACP methyl ester carboxylesterase
MQRSCVVAANRIRVMSTFVLVHGAMHGGWCWNRVRRQLTGLRHEVFTPTLTGLGDRRQSLTPEVGVETHITDLTDLLYFEDLREVHLVLHSYAGVLAGPVVERAFDRVRSVIFLGAFMAEDGQSLLDVEPPEIRARYQELATKVGEGWRLPADDSFLTQWGVPEDLRPIVGPRLTDFPLRCATDVVRYGSAALQSVQRSYIRHTQPPLPSLEQSYERAVQHGCVTFDIACGHDAMLDDPAGTVALLREIAGQ